LPSPLLTRISVAFGESFQVRLEVGCFLVDSLQLITHFEEFTLHPESLSDCGLNLDPRYQTALAGIKCPGAPHLGALFELLDRLLLLVAQAVFFGKRLATHEASFSQPPLNLTSQVLGLAAAEEGKPIRLHCKVALSLLKGCLELGTLFGQIGVKGLQSQLLSRALQVLPLLFRQLPAPRECEQQKQSHRLAEGAQPADGLS